MAARGGPILFAAAGVVVPLPALATGAAGLVGAGFGFAASSFPTVKPLVMGQEEDHEEVAYWIQSCM